MKNGKYYFNNKCLIVEKNSDYIFSIVPNPGKNLNCIKISQITSIEVKRRNIFHKPFLIFIYFLIVASLLKIFSVFDESLDIFSDLGKLFFIFINLIMTGGFLLPIFFREFSKRIGILYNNIIIETSGKKRFVLIHLNEDEINVFLDEFFKEI